MSQVAENVIPVPEVIEHFGEAQAVIKRLMRDADRAVKTQAARFELFDLHAACVSASWHFAETNKQKSSAYCQALLKIEDALIAQSGGWDRSRTLLLAARVAVRAANAL